MGDIKLHEGESLVRHGKANRLVRAEAVGGHLTLTSQRLLFRPHTLNIQRKPFEIPLTNLEKATTGPLWNGITITLKSGPEEKFVVFRRRAWLRIIDELTRP